MEGTDGPFPFPFLGPGQGAEELFGLTAPPVGDPSTGQGETSHEQPEHPQSRTDAQPDVATDATEGVLIGRGRLVDLKHGDLPPARFEHWEVELQQLAEVPLRRILWLVQIRHADGSFAGGGSDGMVGEPEGVAHQLGDVRIDHGAVERPHLDPHRVTPEQLQTHGVLEFRCRRPDLGGDEAPGRELADDRCELVGPSLQEVASSSGRDGKAEDDGDHQGGDDPREGDPAEAPQLLPFGPKGDGQAARDRRGRHTPIQPRFLITVGVPPCPSPASRSGWRRPRRSPPDRRPD